MLAYYVPCLLPSSYFAHFLGQLHYYLMHTHNSCVCFLPSVENVAKYIIRAILARNYICALCGRHKTYCAINYSEMKWNAQICTVHTILLNNATIWPIQDKAPFSAIVFLCVCALSGDLYLSLECRLRRVLCIVAQVVQCCPGETHRVRAEMAIYYNRGCSAFVCDITKKLEMRLESSNGTN